MLPPITACCDSAPPSVEREPVPLEDAGALPELGDAGVPGAALRHRDFQHVLRGGAAGGEARQRGSRNDDPGGQHG
jgi:hypothetical protein